jgi:hypothetical protein
MVRSSTVTRSRSRPRNRLRRDIRGYGCVLCWLGIILSSAYEHSEVADGHDEGCPGRRFQCFIDNCGARFRRRGFGPNPSRGCRVRRFRLWFFQMGYPFYYPSPAYYPPPPSYPAPASYPESGTPSQRSGVTLPLHLPRARRSSRRRGAAGGTRRVNIAGNTRPPDPRATVRPSVTAPPAGTRAANGAS